MRERLVGREQEYGRKIVLDEEKIAQSKAEFKGILNAFFPEPPPLSDDNLRLAQAQKIIGAFTELGIPFLPSHANSYDLWLSNGSRLYIDYNQLIETASPECRVGGLDIVLYEKASEMILNKAIQNLLASGVFKELSFYKNNTGPSGGSDIFPEITYGHHQNYMYAEGKENDISQILKTFIPISLILSGSGHVCRINSNWRYLLSPRATHIVCEESGNTTNERPLINSRERPNRFHLISRDATRCEFQTWLVDMTTHLVMRLAEEGWKMPDGFALQTPVASLHISNSSFEDYLNNQSGTWFIDENVDVLRYNKVFLEAAKQLSPLSEEESDALEEWQRVLELLAAKNLDELVGELDWVTKWNLIRNQMKKHGYGLDDVRAWKTDLAYHDISSDPNQSWFARLDNLGFIRHLADSADIRAAMENPPADTRALSRGRLILLASMHKGLKNDIKGLDWGSASIRPEDVKDASMYFFGKKDNPFSAVSPELEKLYAERYGIFSE